MNNRNKNEWWKTWWKSGGKVVEKFSLSFQCSHQIDILKQKQLKIMI